MHKSNTNIKFLFFLFGLGGQLQIIASLSFTELFVFTAAPFIFFKEWYYLKRNGMATFFYISICVVLGCAVACWVNHSPPFAVLRGMAVTSLLPCTVIVAHWLLRKDLNGFKWSLIGGAISGVFCTFWFQKSVDVAMLAKGVSGEAAVDAIVNGPLYWIGQIGTFTLLLPKGWYLHFPTGVSVILTLFVGIFSILTSASGRGASVRSLASAAVMIIGGRRCQTMKRIGRYFWILVFLGSVGAFLVKEGYSMAASQGLLGEVSRKKYEMQTKGDKSLKAIILGGRMESFCGILACLDNPIIGYGPWAVDEKGYVAEFLAKFATREDYESFLKAEEYHFAHGITTHLIPCHAFITEFWCWYGIAGLVFWLYAMFVMLRYLRQDCWAIPQWFMWIAAAVPGYFWGIFFSPWSERVGGVMFIVACLMARAVRQNRQPLPKEMIDEIRTVEQRR